MEEGQILNGPGARSLCVLTLFLPLLCYLWQDTGHLWVSVPLPVKQEPPVSTRVAMKTLWCQA